MGGECEGLPPAGPHPLERGHDEITGPRPRRFDDGFAQLVDGQLRAVQDLADGCDDLLRLLPGKPHALGEGACAHGKRPQSADPHGQVGGGQQMDGAARAVRLDQAVPLPQGVADVGPCGGLAPHAEGEFGCGEHLGVRAAEDARDPVGTGRSRRRREGAAVEPPRGDLVPRQLRDAGIHGPACLLPRSACLASALPCRSAVQQQPSPVSAGCCHKGDEAAPPRPPAGGGRPRCRSAISASRNVTAGTPS